MQSKRSAKKVVTIAQRMDGNVFLPFFPSQAEVTLTYDLFSPHIHESLTSYCLMPQNLGIACQAEELN